ncbi:MAG: AMP-binding protein [Burkholderiales bacterium]|nr:AMP-binding protein [Burkholderiales bacterium]
MAQDQEGKVPLEYFYHWERTTPDKVFLTQPAPGGVVRDITWREAGDEVRRIAAWLKAQGWPAGSRVAILGKNSAHWMLSDLAVMMAGHVSVPMYSTFSADALNYILTHSESRACFVGKLDEIGGLKDGVPPGLPIVTLPLSPAAVSGTPWDAIIKQTAPLKESPVNSPEDLWTIVYTSGTTGRSKGVMLKFAALKWAAGPSMARVRITGDDRFLSYLPLAHIMERVVLEVPAVHYGAHVYFADALDTFLADLKRARPTVFMSVPRLWVKFQQGVHAKMPPQKLKRLLRIPILRGIVRRKVLAGLGLEHCRLAGSGAAPLPAEVLRWYRDLGLDMVEGYGMTENAAISHATLPGTSHPGTVGVPYTGVESRLDPETGEVQMRSPAVMAGYYKEPELTQAAFTADGWLRTGDKGRIDANGCLVITGRVKDIFKTSKGKYVAPAPIEDLLVNHPAIEAAVVSGGNLDQPVGLVMLSPEAAAAAKGAGRAALAEQLAAHLKSVNEKLDAHEKLQCIAAVTTPWTPESGFVTPTLKVRRNRIDEVYGPQFEAWVKASTPVVWA